MVTELSVTPVMTTGAARTPLLRTSVTVLSCVMISALLFAFADRWEDDGEDFCFVRCSPKLKQVQLDSPQPLSGVHFLIDL